MALKICLSGTTDVVSGTENFNELEIQSWLAVNQERKPLEGEEGYEAWPYSDLSKYVCLNFENGVHTPTHE
jgi:hypothetical protein